MTRDFFSGKDGKLVPFLRKRNISHYVFVEERMSQRRKKHSCTKGMNQTERHLVLLSYSCLATLDEDLTRKLYLALTSHLGFPLLVVLLLTAPWWSNSQATKFSSLP